MLSALVVGLSLSTSVQAFEVTDRWGTTATDGNTGSLGDPITVTWGFVDDGTTISGSEGSSGSDLLSFLDTQIGTDPNSSDVTQQPWFSIFDDSFSRLGELSGVTYNYEPNNSGQRIDFSARPTGRLGSRPDVRIGGHSIDGQSGSNTLAYDYLPDHSDMVIDTDNTSFYSNPANSYRAFRNVVMHEAGHGLGISHMESSNAAFLLEPVINTSFDGPQLDDILALHRNYGDALEKNSGNNTSGTATLLGLVAGGGSQNIGTFGDSTTVSASQTDFISIDDNSDTDFFSFTLSDTLETTLNLTPRGATYNEGPQGGSQSSLNTKTLSDLTLALLDTNGSTVLELADANGAGVAESITRSLTAGTYFARVTGANNNVQLYGLDVSGVHIPANLIWTGLQDDAWNVNTTANFSYGGGAAVFQNGDDVTFDDTASVFAVDVLEDVAPSSVTVDTAGSYSFAGTGAIVAGTLTLTGGGTLELANDGNTYDGETDVQEGTLIVSTSTGTGDTTVQSGATVEGDGMIGGDLIALSGATIHPGGEQALTVAGSYSQQAGATFEIELRDAADFDALIVTGEATLDGTLDLQLFGGFTPTAADSFDILTAASGVSGTFSSTLFPDLGALLAMDIFYGTNTVTLTVVSALLGDFDIDGDVDGFDFILWQRGESPDPLSPADLAVWEANYGSVLPLSATSTAVPEPATWAMLLLGTMALDFRRQLRHRGLPGVDTP